MKKTALILFLFFINIGFYAEENIVKNIVSAESGIDYFLNKNLGKELYITIAGQDTTIYGVLTAVFKDAVIIETFLKSEVLIPKSSIAYIRISTVKQKK